MRCFFIGIAGFVLAAVVTAVAVAAYGDYAARASLAETLSSIASLRTEIAENIVKLRTVANAGASLVPPPAQRSFPATDYLKVTADGTIVFRSAKHGQVVVLEPSLRAEAVTWKCVGSKPEKNIPAECR